MEGLLKVEMSIPLEMFIKTKDFDAMTYYNNMHAKEVKIITETTEGPSESALGQLSEESVSRKEEKK